MKPINLYIVRHGETLLNKLAKIQGWSDSPLLKESELLAQRLGQGLKEIDFDCVYSSDSGRVRQTKENILIGYQHENLPSVVDERLREFCFGQGEGEYIRKFWDSIAIENGYQDFDEFKTQVTLVDRLRMIKRSQSNLYGEIYEEFDKRIRGALASIIQEAQSKQYTNILVVSHGATIAAILDQCGFSEPYYSSPKNLSVTKLTYENASFKVVYENNTEFLEQLV